MPVDGNRVITIRENTAPRSCGRVSCTTRYLLLNKCCCYNRHIEKDIEERKEGRRKVRGEKGRDTSLGDCETLDV